MKELEYRREARNGYRVSLITPVFRSKREELHWKVRNLNLCAFDRATRQAAAADPAIVWDAEARQYRFRPKDGREPCASAAQYLDQSDAAASPPAPAPADLGSADREGASESLRVPTSPTGAGPEFKRSDRFSSGEQ